MITEQLDLFPRATQVNFAETKHLLSKYRWFQKVSATLLEGTTQLTNKERSVLAECQSNIRNLERAINLILDSETREVIEYRYIKGYTHKLTILHFASKMDDRTVDRKLQRGIESIADTLLLLK